MLDDLYFFVVISLLIATIIAVLYAIDDVPSSLVLWLSKKTSLKFRHTLGWLFASITVSPLLYATGKFLYIAGKVIYTEVGYEPLLEVFKVSLLLFFFLVSGSLSILFLTSKSE